MAAVERATTRSLDQLGIDALVAASQRGSVAHYGELCRRFEGRLFNFLLQRTRNRTDAEDLVQDALLRAWEHIGDYDNRWQFSTWLFTIASRLAVTHFRKRRTSQMSDGMPEPSQASNQRTASELEREELGQRLWTIAGERLTHEQHTAVWLRYVEDMGIGEIAQVLRKSQVSVRVLLFRARQVLAREAAALGAGGMDVGAADELEAADAPDRIAFNKMSQAGSRSGSLGGPGIAGVRAVGGST